MKKFWGYVFNNDFSVGCTGQTVFLYDKDGNELGKFKDIIYGYTPMISPDGTLFVVKSTVGRLAVYSLETLSLIKKFRFSKVDGAQDDGFCFSPDGKMFFNVERQKDDLHSAISVYDTTDFSLANQILLGEDMMLDYIEFDRITNSYYVLGFMRNNRVIEHGFVAKFEDNQIKKITAISENEYKFYCAYKRLEIMGFTEKAYEESYFTEKAYEWSYTDYELEELKSTNHTLANLYHHYNK